MLRQETITLKNGEYPAQAAGKDGTVKTENVFTDFKRDEGKTFRYTEMSAVKLEKWSIKLGIMSESLMDNQTKQELSQVKDEHCATLAFLPFAMSSDKNFLQLIDHFNELLYNYEIYDKARGCYIKITSENEDKYIEEIITVGFLRNKALEFLNFFQTGGNADTTKAQGTAKQTPPQNLTR